MIVLASEDIGLADPQALVVAVAAAQAVEHVGLPEARLNLAEAAIYLARAPEVRTRSSRRSARRRRTSASTATYAIRRAARHALLRCEKARARRGYIYPHSDPRGFDVDYLPEPLKGKKYYRPSGSGEEKGDEHGE
jgi:putative ATPase